MLVTPSMLVTIDIGDIWHVSDTQHVGDIWHIGDISRHVADNMRQNTPICIKMQKIHKKYTKIHHMHQNAKNMHQNAKNMHQNAKNTKYTKNHQQISMTP